MGQRWQGSVLLCSLLSISCFALILFSYCAGGWQGLDKQALEGCLGVVALALGVVMAGTGHLPTLKLLRGIQHLH